MLPLPEGLFGEPLSSKEYSAIGIYESVPGRLDRGAPIAWLELLSSNKPGGRDAQDYVDKRLAVLESGIVFVELDYLHESAPTLPGLPSYRPRRGSPRRRGTRLPDRRDRSAPQPPRRHHPRQPIRRGRGNPDHVHPLSGTDALPFDFGLPYRKTFEETLYGLQLVDYGELPQHFDRYSAADQRRIALRMLAVAEAAAEGATWRAGHSSRAI